MSFYVIYRLHTKFFSLFGVYWWCSGFQLCCCLSVFHIIFYLTLCCNAYFAAKASVTHPGRAEFFSAFFLFSFLTNVLRGLLTCKSLHLDRNTKHLFCSCLKVKSKFFFSFPEVIFFSVRSSSGITPWTFYFYLLPNILPKLAEIRHLLYSIFK